MLLTVVSFALITSCASASETSLQQRLSNFYRFSGVQNHSGIVQSVAIPLGSKLSVEATIEKTAKGNGTIQIGNLLLRIYDVHDDGFVYENELLDFALADLDGDSIKEIIISGILKSTGEEAGDPISYTPVTQIYSLNCASALFQAVYPTSPNAHLELNNSLENETACQ
ncbi:MAG TPA: hypothetical protein VIC26_08350 [Marinagarivorans sp.]